MRSTKKTLLGSTAGICLVLSGCHASARNYPVTFVDQSDVLPIDSPDQKPSPLILVVEITGEGRLNLNRIDVGTISDTSLLSERLKTVFRDREKASIGERDVLVELNGTVRGEDLETLFEALDAARASPIRVIKR